MSNNLNKPGGSEYGRSGSDYKRRVNNVNQLSQEQKNALLTRAAQGASLTKEEKGMVAVIQQQKKDANKSALDFLEQTKNIADQIKVDTKTTKNHTEVAETLERKQPENLQKTLFGEEVPLSEIGKRRKSRKQKNTYGTSGHRKNEIDKNEIDKNPNHNPNHNPDETAPDLFNQTPIQTDQNPLENPENDDHLSQRRNKFSTDSRPREEE